MSKKYGLQLRIPPQARKKPPTAPPPPVPLFGDDDADDNDVSRDIARQATKKKVDRDVEELQRKALAEDPTAFDYDGVYDQMKEDAVRPIAVDRHERKSKYIERLMEKAKERERAHEIVYERKLAKERSKDEHLFADKDKFVTSAYKRKLAEQQKWLEEERIRELREERNATGDMTEFYFNLSKNVAFGAKKKESKAESNSNKQLKEEPKVDIDTSGSTSEKEEVIPRVVDLPLSSGEAKVADQVEPASRDESTSDKVEAKAEVNTLPQGNTEAEKAIAEQKERDHHKRTQDALAAAKERFLSRKKAKEN